MEVISSFHATAVIISIFTITSFRKRLQEHIITIIEMCTANIIVYFSLIVHRVILRIITIIILAMRGFTMITICIYVSQYIVLHFASLRVTLIVTEVIGTDNRATSNLPFLLYPSSIAQMQSQSLVTDRQLLLHTTLAPF